MTADLRTSRSLQAAIVVRLALLTAPVAAALACALAAPSAWRQPAAGFALVWLAIGAVLFAVWTRRLLRKRIHQPLETFRTTLEDIREGFILDRIPEAAFREADPAITDAFRQVILINRMLLRNVDNLERGYEEERQAKLAQQALTDAYQRFVPKDFLSFLRKSSITEVTLGDHVRTEMTILVSDIRSFTAISESLSPEENFRLINDYLYIMEPIVNEYHGFIDKYMGDAIMALFHRSPDHAVQVAVRMTERLRAFNAEREAAGSVPLRIGIGLNTGEMMLGIVGGENRMEGTVISDAVNLAARMEDLNKTYGTQILLSEHTYARLEDPTRYPVRRIGKAQVKGKTEAVDVYELRVSSQDSSEAGENE